jgi:hypothetical protein
MIKNDKNTVICNNNTKIMGGGEGFEKNFGKFLFAQCKLHALPYAVIIKKFDFICVLGVW